MSKTKKSFIFIIAGLVTVALLGYPIYKKYLPQSFHDAKKSTVDNMELFVSLKKINSSFANANNIELPKIIAHAGGGINELKYTNSFEALESNYEKGFRWFEMDAIITSDNKLAMLHDWGSAIPGLFNETEGVRSLEEFRSFSMISNLTQMDFDDTAEWFKNHEDAFLILDSKSDLKKTLQIIKINHPNLVSKIIVTINRFNELNTARKMGFKNIIFSAYTADYGKTYADDLIVEFANRAPIIAVSLPEYRVLGDLPKKIKQSNDIFVCAFTIDDKQIMNSLFNNNIDVIYSNYLEPSP